MEICKNCGTQTNKPRRGLCVQCYNAWHYQSIKGKKNFTCPKCKNFDDRSHGGLCSKCYQKKYYENNKKTLIQKAIEWFNNHREHRRNYMREYMRRRWNNFTPTKKKEIYRRQEKNRTLEGREKKHQYIKEYYQKNKDSSHYKEISRKAKEARRARENNVTNTITQSQWGKIKEIYNNRCAYCGNKPEFLTQDHVIPISKGGHHTADNIVPACQPCNRRKGVKSPPPDFVMKKIVFD